MGFRSGAYATVWSVEPKSETWTKVRISVTRKDKNTGEYVQTFSGFIEFLGTAAASKAKQLKEKDRIKLGDTDVESVYKKETKETFYNFKCFSFEMADGQTLNPGAETYHRPDADSFVNIDSNPFDGDAGEELPFTPF